MAIKTKKQKIRKTTKARKPQADRLRPKPKLVKKVTAKPKVRKVTPAKIKAKPKKEIPVSMPPPQLPKEAITPAVTPAPTELEKETQEAKVSVPVELEVERKVVELRFPITVKDLAVKLQEKPSVLIKMLMEMGIIAAINQVLDEKTVAGVCEKFGFKIKKAPDEEEAVLGIHREIDKTEFLKPRAPIITFMGHVDHGKTSLLDVIRKSKIVESEHGSITQHIGAYRVTLSGGEITFLDTPGHEAFTAMRARGASITDIVVLVVAADDGIMPQTIEAIDHSRAADVPIITAINKIDKPQANIDRVKKQLSELGLSPEDWGGKTITVPVSAKTGQGIDELLEMILLEAQMLELKANPKRVARGVVVEAKLTKGRGPVATLLIQNGTLRLNDNIIVGKFYGKIKAMFDDKGQSVTSASPSRPVEALGISGVPEAGEHFFVVEDEKKAKELVLKRQEKEKQEKTRMLKRINLEDLYSQIKEGRLKELNLVIKADVKGSLEAIKETLNKLSTQEIKLNIIHEAVGNINASDAILAQASNALILGFNVNIDERAKELIAKEGVDVRTYNIIYELASDIKAALEGMLEPKLKKVFLGRAEVRKVFKLSRPGTVAGCFVTKGKISRTSTVNLIRNGEVVFEGRLSSLKRFKDDVKEVQEGFECGIVLGDFEDIKEGDIIEAYEIEKIARKL